MKKKIKISQHYLNKVNKIKVENLNNFLSDYKKAVIFYVHYLWNNKHTFISKNKKENTETTVILDIKNDILNCPSFLSVTNIKPDFESKLSVRALSCAATQACGIVKSAIEKRRRLLWVQQDLASKKKRTRSITKRINKTKLVFPKLNNINCELSSSISVIEIFNKKNFDNVLRLTSIGKEYGKIEIPFQHNKHSRSLQNKLNCQLLKSVLVTKDKIDLRWEYDIETTKVCKNNKSEENCTSDSEVDNRIIVGVDTGINSVVTMSDGQQTTSDIHNHTANSILQKICRKKKGSKAFKKALKHHKNFLKWSVNQLNFGNIKQINLEKVSNFRYKNNVGKFLNYSGEAVTRKKLKDSAEEHGVHVLLQSSAYRSQRCSRCGYVYSKNRKGKVFSCKHCSFQADADCNASCNHEYNLPSAHFILYLLDKPKKFFWKEEGFFDLGGQELIVPVTKKY